MMELNSHEIANRVTDKLAGQERAVAWVANEEIKLNVHPVVLATLQVLDEHGFLSIVKPEPEDEYRGADHA